MKTILKAFMMGALVFTLASCGGENESSSKKSSSSSSGGSDGSSGGGISSTGKTLKNYTELRDTFTKMSAASGIKNNEVVYHTGPAFGMELQQVDLDFDFGFCFNLFGDLKGDCEAYENQEGNFNQYNSQLDYVVNSGEYKVVKKTTKNQVDFDLAVGVLNSGFDFDRTVFDRDSEIYRAMLNLDKKKTLKVVVSGADIVVTDQNGKNQKTIKGNLVEYFFDDGTIEGYVLSTGFPLLANPLVVAQGEQDDFGFMPLQATGILNFAGNKTVQSISATTHYLEYDWTRNRWNHKKGQQLRVGF